MLTMKYALAILLLSGCFIHSAAQELTPLFDPIIPVTPTNANGSTRPRIALVNDTVPLVTWAKSGSGNGIVYCAKWNGSAFGTAIQVSPSGLNVYCSAEEGGDIAARGDTAYIVFFTTNSLCYCVHSYDGGNTWSDTVRIDHQDMDHAYTPDVQMDAAGNPVVVFETSDMNMANTRQMVSRSTDGGNSFAQETDAHLGVTGIPCECCPPALLINDSMQYVIYRNNDNNRRNIVMTISSDSGATFPIVCETDQTNWTLSACPTTGAEAAFYRDSVLMIWKSANKIWFGCGHAQTGAEGSDALLEPALTASVIQKHPVVCTAGDTVVYLWDDRRTANYDAYIAIRGNGALPITTPFILNDTAGTAENGIQQTPHAIIEGDRIHIVYQDAVSGRVLYRAASIGGPVGIGEVMNGAPSPLIYPVPANDYFVLSGVNTSSTVEVFAMNGECTARFTRVLPGQQLDCSTWAPGMYLVVITATDGAKSSINLIKQ